MRPGHVRGAACDSALIIITAGECRDRSARMQRGFLSREAWLDDLPLNSALAFDTPMGYIGVMGKNSKTPTLKRLNRIEGQVRGLARMVEDERYCIDIVTQIGAVRAALRRVEEEILRDHVAQCVNHAISSGDKADQRRKVAELMDVMGRAGR